MKKLLKIVGIVSGLALLGIAVIVLDFLRHGGQFRALRPTFAGSCTEIPMDASAEDIQIDRERGIAYLSYLDRRALVERKPVTGTIMLLDLNTTKPRPRAALAFHAEGFRPHGLSLSTGRDDRQRLFVISHAGGSHSVEIFERTDSGAFTPSDSVRDPLIDHPNGIAALGDRQFYIANDSGARNGFERFQELIFRRGLSNLVYYNGREARVVDSGLKSATGIALSPDTSKLYVAESSAKQLRVYERDLATGAVKLEKTVTLDGVPDNVNVAEDGSVWIAVHARTLAVLRHFMNPAVLAPTTIVRYDPAAPEGQRLTTIYMNLGEQISTGSVGASVGQRLLIGSITDRKVLLCDRR